MGIYDRDYMRTTDYVDTSCRFDSATEKRSGKTLIGLTIGIVVAGALFACLAFMI